MEAGLYTRSIIPAVLFSWAKTYHRFLSEAVSTLPFANTTRVSSYKNIVKVFNTSGVEGARSSRVVTIMKA
jgi:hypothetical protein